MTFSKPFAILSLLLLVLTGSAKGQSVSKAVLTEKDAYLQLPPQILSGPTVKMKSISTNGQNIVIQRESAQISRANIPSTSNPNPAPPKVSQELIFWNLRTQNPVSMWKSSDDLTQVDFAGWMQGTDSAYAVIIQSEPVDPKKQEPPKTHPKLYRLSNGLKRAVEVALPVIPDNLTLHAFLSPKKSSGLIRLAKNDFSPDQDSQAIYCFLNQDGQIGGRVENPEGRHSWVVFDEEGDPVLQIRNNDAKVEYYAVNDKTGATTLLPKMPKIAAEAGVISMKAPIHVVSKRVDLSDFGIKDKAGLLWVESDFKSKQMRSLITSDGSDATLLSTPSGDMGTLYTSQGALWFQPLLRLDKVEFLKMKKMADRITAISNARQLGTGILMYSQDYDEKLPTPDGINDKIAPYLRNDALFDGFGYTYAGGNLGDISAPGMTPIGYVGGDGGRAVIYADGHVKWEDDK